MVKGTGFPLLITATLVIGVIIVSHISLNFPWIDGVESSAVFQQEIYNLDNSLDAASIYLDTSMRYSIYQACHDLLKNPDPDEFYLNLSNKTKIFLNKYLSQNFYFLDIYQVDFPVYNITYDSGELIANSSDNISVDLVDTKLMEKVHLERNLEIKQDAACSDLYNKYLETRNELSDKVTIIIVDALSAWPEEAENIATSCDNLFFITTGKTIQEAEQEISSEIKITVEDNLPENDTNIYTDLTRPEGIYQFSSSEVIPKVTIRDKLIFSLPQTSEYKCEYEYDVIVPISIQIIDETRLYTIFDEEIKTVKQTANLTGEINETGFISSQI